MKTTFAAAALIALVAADEYDHGHPQEDSGPIAPESYGYAVNAWDIDTPTIDAECYAHQTDICSCQIVAIEATRVILTKLIKRVEWAENEIEENAAEIADNRSEIRENDWETRANAADIRELEDDISDVEDCLERQQAEQGLNRAVVELYCHSQAYVQWVMDECREVLVSGTRLPYGVDTASWTINTEATPASSPHTH
mgnify:CR=1 FL=1